MLSSSAYLTSWAPTSMTGSCAHSRRSSQTHTSVLSRDCAWRTRTKNWQVAKYVMESRTTVVDSEMIVAIYQITSDLVIIIMSVTMVKADIVSL